MSEYKVSSFYADDKYDKYFFDTVLASKMGVEKFLSDTILKGDLTRVCYATEDISFRRRLETVGSGVTPESNIVSLNMPFATISTAGNVEEDDRPNAMNMAQYGHGIIDYRKDLGLQAQAVKIPFRATVFYARRDDVDRAAQKLYFVKNPKAPVWVVMRFEYYGQTIEIPVFIQIESIDSNPDYKEADWLKQRKIFPLQLKMSIYTYYIKLKTDVDLRFTGRYEYDNGAEIAYTERFILDFVSALGQHIDEHVESESSAGPLVVETEDESGADKIRKVETSLSTNGIKEVVSGYFADERHCSFQEFYYKDKCIYWKINPAEEAYFQSLSIYVADKVKETITDSGVTKFELPWIQENSIYTCILVLSSVDGNKITYNLTVGDQNMIDIVGDTFTGLRLED